MPAKGTFRQRNLTASITTAVTAVSTPVSIFSGCSYLAAQATLTYGSGGTTVNVYVQTSLDGGLTWADIMNFSFTTATATKISSVVNTTALAGGITPTDGSIAANTILSGLLGTSFRVKYITTGTYAGTTLTVDLVGKD